VHPLGAPFPQPRKARLGRKSTLDVERASPFRSTPGLPSALSMHWSYLITVAAKEFDHLVVFHLTELTVELPHGEEIWRSFETLDLVAIRPDISEAVRRRARHGEDQPLGLLRAHGVQRRDHRCTGRQAIVHDDRDAASRLDRRPRRRVLSP